MWYVDSSAAVKLVVEEDHSTALRGWIAEHRGAVVACDLLRTEVLRAVRREEPDAVGRARSVLDAITLLTMPTERFAEAAAIDPVELRSLDALHLAAARRLGDDLEGIVAYDTRLIVAARGYGIAAVSPGADG